MELLSPLSLAWLGLLAPLVALYVLKRRREKKVIASTMLWEAALRDLRAERPWQRLRPHLSLILQALALIAGALALARPSDAGRAPSGARIAVVIDASLSMAARDGESTRIDRALRQARTLARDLPPGGEMMVIAAGREADVVAPLSRDRVEIERGLDRVALRGGRADLEGAVSVAAERMRGAPAGSRVVVFTDAAFAGTTLLESSVPVEVRRTGEPVVNHAITALDVRARPTPDAPDRAEIFVRVARFGEGASDVRVSAAIEDGALLATRRVRVAAGSPEAVILRADLPPDAEGRGALVHAWIDVLDGSDALAVDDVAVAPSPAARRLPVFLVGDAPASVRRVLRTDREVELYEARPSALSDDLDGLFVFAGATPASPPAGDSIVVAPAGESVFGVELGPAVDRPTVVSWDEADPRMRFVRFGDVHLGAVRPIRAAGAQALLTTDAGTAIGAAPRTDGETTIIALDPDDGDWSARPGFVVFFRNLLERARARRAAGGISDGALGDPLRVPAPDGALVQVETPERHTREARSHGGVAIVDVPPEPGVYRVRVGDRERFALRHLLDAEESDLAPRASFTTSDGRTASLIAQPIEQREAWPWVAGVLLALLALEVLWATRKGAPA